MSGLIKVWSFETGDEIWSFETSDLEVSSFLLKKNIKLRTSGLKL
jgi:hypothetical protein